jgi:hypothetical protein
LTLSSLFFDQLLGPSHLLLRGDQRFTETFKLGTEFAFRLLRVRGRDEWKYFSLAVVYGEHPLEA